MTNVSVKDLSSADLLAATRALVRSSCAVEADLLLHLSEIDERKLFLERGFPSMFAYCTDELGFSEDAAFNRIRVAREARRFPILLDAVRSGHIHLAGLRILAPHLTEENHLAVLSEAVGCSKREIEEIAARLSPQPPVAATVRRVAHRGDVVSATCSQDAAFALPFSSAPLSADGSAPPNGDAAVVGTALPLAVEALTAERGDRTLLPQTAARRAIVKPLNPDAYKVTFSASKPFRDKLRRAQELLRHRIPDGNIAVVIETALDVLLEQVMKERFAVGRKPRSSRTTRTPDTTPEVHESVEQTPQAPSRHIPDAIKRAVYERDGGQCTFVGENGRRCATADNLEFEHEEGFALTGTHDVKKIRLLCRSHNQYAAEKLYGREFMERARQRAKEERTRPGASPESGKDDGGGGNSGGGWNSRPPSA